MSGRRNGICKIVLTYDIKCNAQPTTYISLDIIVSNSVFSSREWSLISRWNCRALYAYIYMYIFEHSHTRPTLTHGFPLAASRRVIKSLGHPRHRAQKFNYTFILLTKLLHPKRKKNKKNNKFHIQKINWEQFFTLYKL